MADSWLTDATVRGVIGSDLAQAIPPDALAPWASAAGEYVQDRRPDLVDDDGTFTPTPNVTAGAALLAYRWYKRRTSPLGVTIGGDDGGTILRHDPDIAKLCGIGPGRTGFRFG